MLESASITVTYHVATTTEAASGVGNTASADADDFAGPATGTDSVDILEDVVISVTKSFGIDDPVTAGTSGHTFTITVTNSGASQADNITLDDTVDGRLIVDGSSGDFDCTASSGQTIDCELDDLDSLESASITVTYHVAASTAAALVPNSASADADDFAGPATDTASVTIQTRADVAITKSDGVTTVTAGDGVVRTYLITVSNTGPSDALGVSVADTFPSGFAIGTVTPSQGSCTGSPSFSVLGTIIAGGSATISATYTVPASTTVSPQLNTATVSATTADPDPSDNSATDSNTVATSADLSITKTAAAGPYYAGANLTYTINVQNLGPSNSAGYTLTDVLPPSTTFVSASVGCANVSGTVTCAALGLAAGLTDTSTITLKIASNYANATTLSNTASIATSATSDPIGANNSSTSTVTVTRSADLSIAQGRSGHGDDRRRVRLHDHGHQHRPIRQRRLHGRRHPPDRSRLRERDGGGLHRSLGHDHMHQQRPSCRSSTDYTIRVKAAQMPGAINTAGDHGQQHPGSKLHGNNSAGAITTFNPGTMLSDVATGDPDWTNHIDGVDVLFQKNGSGSTTSYKLKATNPGTFRYRLSLENETGMDIRVKNSHLPNIIRRGVSLKDRNGASTTVFLTVPAMPSSVGTGTQLPAQPTRQKLEPAFVLDGYKPVKAHPNDRTDEMPISVRYLPGSYPWPTGSDCANPAIQGAYLAMPSNANGLVARCIRVEGLEIKKHEEAHVHVAYEFRWKEHSGTWGSQTVDPTIAFRAGFNFKSTTEIELLDMPDDVEDRLDHQLLRLPAAVRPIYKANFMALWNNTYTGSHALGLTFAGERVTAVGGFLFDPSGERTAGYHGPPVLDYA